MEEFCLTPDFYRSFYGGRRLSFYRGLFFVVALNRPCPFPATYPGKLQDLCQAPFPPISPEADDSMGRIESPARPFYPAQSAILKLGKARRFYYLKVII
jgi:hypothetical protein